jgi:hypothetical protein
MLVYPFLNANRSIYRLREVLEALVNLDNSEVSLLIKIEVLNLNKIRSNLCSHIAGRFWHSKRPN